MQYLRAAPVVPKRRSGKGAPVMGTHAARATDRRCCMSHTVWNRSARRCRSFAPPCRRCRPHAGLPHVAGRAGATDKHASRGPCVRNRSASCSRAPALGAGSAGSTPACGPRRASRGSRPAAVPTRFASSWRRHAARRTRVLGAAGGTGSASGWRTRPTARRARGSRGLRAAARHASIPHTRNRSACRRRGPAPRAGGDGRHAGLAHVAGGAARTHEGAGRANVWRRDFFYQNPARTDRALKMMMIGSPVMMPQ